MADEEKPKLRVLTCKYCGVQTAHRASILRQICAHLPESSIETERINYRCPRCKHLQRVWLPWDGGRGAQQNETTPLADTIPYLAAILCDEQSCDTHISVFAPMEPETEQSRATGHLRASVVDEDVSCSMGSRCRIPVEVAGIKLVEPEQDKKLCSLTGPAKIPSPVHIDDALPLRYQQQRIRTQP